MKLNFSSELKELQSLFPCPLYVVGGAVRDTLIGFDAQDFDLASELRSEEVFDILKNTRFRAEHNSLKLGTLSIRGHEKYEYTAFRKDSYVDDGRHAPSKVEFVKDLEVDARRRDFTVNAIYASILTGEIIDPLNGIPDIKARVIRTVKDPHEVLNEDALRIMRMARFACSLGFEIDPKTQEVASERAPTLSSIAPERIKDELEKILKADTVYGVSGAHMRGIEILRETGALKTILPEIWETIGVKQNPTYHKYDVYGHILRTMATLPPKLRLIGLLHDIGKPELIREHGRASGHAEPSARMTKEILERLRYSKEYTRKAVKLVSDHMYDLSGDTSEEKVRVFVALNYSDIPDLITLKIADWDAGGNRFGVSPSAVRLEKTYKSLAQEGVPLTVKDLPVKGEELEGLGIPPHERSEALKELLIRGVNDPSVRTRDGAVKFLELFKEE